ncbi:hypothetical protein ACWDSL_42700 [Streptomyces sp. NPDC000941]
MAMSSSPRWRKTFGAARTQLLVSQHRPQKTVVPSRRHRPVDQEVLGQVGQEQAGPATDSGSLEGLRPARENPRRGMSLVPLPLLFRDRDSEYTGSFDAVS